MEEKGKETITAFDTALTTNRIQMLKVFLSFLAPEQQGGLAIYIKLSELQFAMQLARQYPGRPLLRSRPTVLSLQSLLNGSLFNGDQSGVLELLDELLPFSSPGERTRIQNMKNMLLSISRLREMMDMMEMMKELFPEGMGDGADIGDMFSAMSGMGNMGSTEDMNNMFSGMDLSALTQMMQMFQGSADSDSDEVDDNIDKESGKES